MRPPASATARLTGHVAPVPDDTRRNVTKTYQALRTHPFRPNRPAVAPDAGIDHAADARVITRAAQSGAR